MKRLILFRHGQRYLDWCENPDDGPLVLVHSDALINNARQLGVSLTDRGVSEIDFVAVSGSIRCAETFAYIWRSLMDCGIRIATYDMWSEFFGTEEEGAMFRTIYRDKRAEFEELRKQGGEVAAYCTLIPDAVIPCALRTRDALSHAFARGAATVMAVTHSPHEALIEAAFTGEILRRDPIMQGAYKMIELPD